MHQQPTRSTEVDRDLSDLQRELMVEGLRELRARRRDREARERELRGQEASARAWGYPVDPDLRRRRWQ